LHLYGAKSASDPLSLSNQKRPKKRKKDGFMDPSRKMWNLSDPAETPMSQDECSAPKNEKTIRNLVLMEIGMYSRLGRSDHTAWKA
jgi:hypothetical protein